MSVANFIPKIWSSSLQIGFQQQAIAAGLTNTEYTGVLAKGNTVQVSEAVDVEIKDYKANGRTTTPDAVATRDNSLVIDQEKNFDFLVDDIDEVQAAGSMDAFTKTAVHGLAMDADRFLFAKAVAGAHADNVIPGAVFDPEDAKAAYNIMKAGRAALNKKNVPHASRYAIINSDFESALLAYDSKFTSATGLDTANQAVREAVIGRILGFNTLVTDNLPGSLAASPVAQAVFVYTPAWHYVSQISKTEAMRANNSFADRLRGLHVYGGKVMRPEAVATFTATTA